MIIAVDDPRSDDVTALLVEHLADMHATSPAESVHALDVAALTGPAITLWSARAEAGGSLLGIGALKVHDDSLGELKSLRTAPSARGRGVASDLLTTIIEAARDRGLAQLALETGTEPYFAAAHRLYARHGFVPTGPFADYGPDPNSAFYLRALGTR